MAFGTVRINVVCSIKKKTLSSSVFSLYVYVQSVMTLIRGRSRVLFPLSYKLSTSVSSV